MKPDKFIKHLSEIQFEDTNHGSGRKKVFLAHQDTETDLTQFAYGEFQPGESCDRHIHPTMDECFYFISGKGTYVVGEEEFGLSAGTFLRIPAGTPHELRCTGEMLTFVYFGVVSSDERI